MDYVSNGTINGLSAHVLIIRKKKPDLNRLLSHIILPKFSVFAETKESVFSKKGLQGPFFHWGYLSEFREIYQNLAKSLEI